MTKEVNVSINDGGIKELPEPGYVNAVCAFVEELGVAEVEWNGQRKLQRKVVICWELAHLMSDGRPFMLSRTYTASFHEKANLRRDLEAWRGRSFTDAELQRFNLATLERVGCTLNVGLYRGVDGRERAGINGIGPKMKAAVTLLPVNQTPPPWVSEQREKNEKAQALRETGGPVPPEELRSADEQADDVPF